MALHRPEGVSEKEVSHLNQVKKIRLSIGSAITLGLFKGWIEAPLSTLYMLTYREGKCISNCGFCSQARLSASREDRLSRVTWPLFEFEDVVRSLRRINSVETRRICLQSLYYHGFFEEACSIIARIKKDVDIPLSLSCQPLTVKQMGELKSIGLDNICIPLDAASKKVFEKVKGRGVGGPYRWEDHLAKLRHAVKIFNRRRVSTHFIVGIGERDRDLLSTIQSLSDEGIVTSLFAFTPIPGTILQDNPRPPITRYRILQVANYLINNGFLHISSIKFGSRGEIIGLRLSNKIMNDIILKGIPFKTYGCENCDRPYYNEKVSGPLYNYPRYPAPHEIGGIISSLDEFIT